MRNLATHVLLLGSLVFYQDFVLSKELFKLLCSILILNFYIRNGCYVQRG